MRDEGSRRLVKVQGPKGGQEVGVPTGATCRLQL